MFKVKESRIGSRGLYIILSILLITKLFLGIPRALAVEGGPAAWLLIVSSTIVAIPGIFIIVILLKRFPGKNFIEIAEIVLGRPGAIVVSLVLSMFFLLLATVIVREFAETVLTTVLPRTPLSVISFFFITAMLIGAYNGLEVITRTSTLLFPFILVGIFSILLLTANFINLNSLFPILGGGLSKIAMHSLGRSSLYMEMIFAGIIASSIKDPEKIPQHVWNAFFSSMIIFILVELFYISVLRIGAATRLYVPLYQLARLIYQGRFIQRIESVYIFIWFFIGGLKLTLTLYGAAVSLSWGFKIPIYQPLLFPLSLIIFAVSFIPASFTGAITLDTNIFQNYGAIVSWGVPFLLFFVALIRKKGGDQTEKQAAK